MGRKHALPELRRLISEDRYEIDFEALAERLLARGALGESGRVRRRFHRRGRDR